MRPVPLVTTLRTSALIAALIVALIALLGATVVAIATPAHPNPEAALLIEADTGKVLHAENATMPWYPASLTKLMTAYVTLRAVNEGRITLDTLATVSARAAAQLPTKMGFKPGMQLTIDNALKMLMVKSANDMAIVLAEGVSGSVEKFADEMNHVSKTLGMTQSHWVNPNGLPDENQISSARDLAILGRALLRDFPEYDLYWNIPAIQLGKRVMRNYNTLIGRYDGADGMKTGFICASGFNLVASATRRNKRLIAVVLGSPSSPYRGAKAAGLLERGFHRGPLAWLAPSLGTVESLQPINAAPPDLHDAMCGPHRKRPAAERADDETDDDTENGSTITNLPSINGKPSALVKEKQAVHNPIVVFLGAAKKSAETQFAAARAKLAKLGKGKQGTASAEADSTPPAANANALTRDPHTAPVPASAPATPPSNQFQRSARAKPGAIEASNPPWMSFAPPAQTATPPLTATPDAKPELQAAAVPLPRPRPKLAAKRAQ